MHQLYVERANDAYLNDDLKSSMSFDNIKTMNDKKQSLSRQMKSQSILLFTK